VPDPNRPHRTVALVVAALVLVLEGLAVVAFGALEITQFFQNQPALGVLGVLLVGYGGGLLLAARGVWLGRRWARAPSLVAQLIQLPIAWNLRQGPTAGLAAGLGLTAVVAVVCLLLPSSTAVFNPPSEEGADHPER
jgi:uncharacterized membrane protein (DUF2068 family)